MANPLKGEVELKIGDKTMVLCFPSNRIVEVETMLDQDIIAIGQSIASRPSYGTIRTLLWGAMLEHSPKATLMDAGAVMDECEGGLQGIVEPVVRALRFRLSRTPVDAPLDDGTAEA